MITLRPWGYTDFDASIFGSTLNIIDFPKQYNVPKIVVNVWGKIDITAGGAADYQIGPLFAQRFMKNIAFKLGSGNLLKDIPGYASYFESVYFFPVSIQLAFPQEGDWYAVGSSIMFSIYFNVMFNDYNTILSDQTALVPSLYEDLTLSMQFADSLPSLCTAGDRPFNVEGRISTMIIQENNPANVPNDQLREYTELKLIEKTGILEIDLPRASLIETIFVWFLEDGIPSNNPIVYNENWKIDVNNGELILYESIATDFVIAAAQDSNLIYNLNYSPVVLNLNMNHDLTNIFDNRTASKWTLKLPVTYSAPVTREVLLHYLSRTPKT